ncbi:hypothetical protein HU200_058109 [Digitaria exilis]|uniref:peroxidase n=1 Tax=Digitaria exilis TaxID=1010633 RepID=A0A835AE02_9POAL|nr:hypothetical protein HU200_058109 [Digitaria exilis]
MPQNQGLQQSALELIESIRDAVHRRCGATVSCADILAVATAHAVNQAGGPVIPIALGRRDSLEPAPGWAVATLPRPDADVTTLINAFGSKGLGGVDLVALSGAHTVGKTRCSAFADRTRSPNDAFTTGLAQACATDANRLQELDVISPERVLVVAAAVGLLVAAAAAVSAGSGGLSVYFHVESCPQLETIVRSNVDAAIRQNVRLTAGLLRVFFHDCFPQGCDASILLDNVLLSGPKSEQLEIPNQTLRPEALKLIDDIRGALSDACGGPTVSCADITTLATRDAVAASGGPLFDVPLGRRDGLAPASSNLVGTLPAPVFDVPTLLEAFSNRSLDTADLVALSGAHTVGRGHCPSFSDRLPPNADMDPALRQKLAAKCGKDPNAEQVLDVRTPNAFDNKYYLDLITKQGLFTSDQGLINHPATKRIATRFALNQAAFFDQFATSMLKMSQMDVLTGNDGEVRLNCALTNAAAGEGHAADA